MAFISQEAREKAREIQVKADEEFAIEKVCTEMTQKRDCCRLSIGTWLTRLLQAKIVRQESLAIDAQFEKKRKQAEVSWKMYVRLIWPSPNPLNHPSSSQSTAINNSRLKILQSRSDHLETLFDEANKQVMELSAGDRYKDALVNLILEVSLSKM